MKGKKDTISSAMRVCAGLCVVFLAQLSSAVTLDLTTAGTDGHIDGGYFMQINPDSSAGTGVFDSFLRIQGTDTEKGYNTDGAIEAGYDTKTGVWTHSLSLSAVPTVAINGDGTIYREFCLDINQTSSAPFSLDTVKIYLETDSTIALYSGFSNLVWDMDAIEDSEVLMNYTLNAGSGQGDVTMYIADSLFTGGDYVYLYSEFGATGVADDGFEEWGVGVGGPIVPEPATLALLGLGGLLLRRRK
ncbi:MAG: PEP-CTERM sorting domain-containing protein [Planctomycetota bacterium]